MLQIQVCQAAVAMAIPTSLICKDITVLFMSRDQ